MTGAQNPGRPRRAIRHRLIVSFAALGAFIVAIGALSALFAVVSLGSAEAATRHLYEDADRVESLRDAVREERNAVSDYLLGRNPANVGRYESAVRDEAAIEAAIDASSPDPELEVRAAAVQAALAAWRSSFADAAVAAVEEGGVVSPAQARAGADLANAASAATIDLAHLIDDRQRAMIGSGRAYALEGVGGLTAELGVLLVGLGLLGFSLIRSVSDPIDRLIEGVRRLGRGEPVSLELERDDEIGELAATLSGLYTSLEGRYDEARVQAERAELFNRYSERISFAGGEAELIDAATEVVRRLVPGSSGSLLLVNASADHLSVGASWGTDERPRGSRVDAAPADCPGLRRGALLVIDDAGDALGPRCLAEPVRAGTLVCAPMIAAGETVGVLHVALPAPHALGAHEPRDLLRVAEQVALAVANARLVRTMEGLAMTDPLTGLRNARFFDAWLDRRLAAIRRGGPQLALLFVDLDHFKEFNDRFGHPAGDEALRAFGRAVTGRLRPGDLVARYGGEEFIVAVGDADLAAGEAVAEKVRLAIEQLAVPIGPGRTARITASIGVAASAVHGTDRLTLLRVSDQALYEAKQSGRNRVGVAPPPAAAVAADGRPGTERRVVPLERRRPRPPRTRPGAALG